MPVKELEKISGFGKAKADSYGHQFLEVILDYSSRHGLSSLIHQREDRPSSKPKATRNRKPDTKAISFELYKTGK